MAKKSEGNSRYINGGIRSWEKFFNPVLKKYLEKDTLVLEKIFLEKICMRSLFFTDRRAFRMNLTCSGKSYALEMFVLELYRRF